MKLNWPTGIVLFFICFVGALVFVFIQSRKVDNSLVLDKYYEEDLRYQQMYEKKENTAKLPQRVRVETNRTERQLLLVFPVEEGMVVTGRVWLYNPASQSEDVHTALAVDSAGRFQMPYPGGAAGRWKVKIDWMGGSTPYYQEEEVIF